MQYLAAGKNSCWSSGSQPKQGLVQETCTQHGLVFESLGCVCIGVPRGLEPVQPAWLRAAAVPSHSTRELLPHAAFPSRPVMFEAGKRRQ